MLRWPTLTRRTNDAMARTLLVLLLVCLVSLHTALSSAAADNGPVKIVSVLADNTADGTDTDAPPVSPHAGTTSHDSCNWLAEWHSPVIRETHHSPLERRARTIPFGLVSLVVPPPR